MWGRVADIQEMSGQNGAAEGIASEEKDRALFVCPIQHFYK